MKIMSSLFAPALFSLALMGCGAGADWKSANVAPGYAAPKQMEIVIKQSATGEDAQAAVLKLRQALLSELKAMGVTATAVDQPSSPPTATVNITQWDKGQRVARMFVGAFGVGEGTITVQLAVATAESPQAIQGEATGYIKFGFFGGEDYESIEQVAKKIAKLIATGKRDD